MTILTLDEMLWLAQNPEHDHSLRLHKCNYERIVVKRWRLCEDYPLERKSRPYDMSFSEYAAHCEMKERARSELRTARGLNV